MKGLRLARSVVAAGIAIVVLGACGGGSASTNFLSTHRVSLSAGESKSFHVSRSDRVDLVTTGTVPEGVLVHTEGGLGTSRVDMKIETEAGMAPGEYRIDFHTYQNSPTFGYTDTGKDTLKLTVSAAPATIEP